MASFVAIYDNFGLSAILSGGSWLSNLPLSNMFDAALGKVARSSGLTTAATQFRMDLGSILTVGGLAIGPTNLNPGAEYRITAYEDNAFTVMKYDSGFKLIPGISIDSLDLEWEDPAFWYGDVESGIFPWIIEIVPTAEVGVTSNAQYWKVEIVNTGNPDGYVEIGYCLIGRTFRPSINFNEDNSFTRLQLTDIIEALGGHRDYWHRGSRRKLRVTWWRLEDTEGWDDIYRIMTQLGTHDPMFVVPDPDDDDNIQKRSFLGTLTQSPELRLIIQDGVTTGFEVEEVL